MGDIGSEGVRDEDRLLQGVGVGRRIADDSGEKAVLGGVERGGIKEGAAEFDGFEGIVAVEEFEGVNRLWICRGEPEVECEVAGVQRATGVEEGAEGKGRGKAGAEVELNMQEVVVDGDRHRWPRGGTGVEARSACDKVTGTADLSGRGSGGRG